MTAVCVFVGAVLVVSGCLALLCLRCEPDTYPPEAAEAPTYERASLREDIGPCVVAGSDLDWADKQDIGVVNDRFARLLAEDEELAELKRLDLSAYYVLPEGER